MDDRLQAHEAPGPAGSFLLGSIREIVRDPLALLAGSAERYGEVVRFRFGPPPRRRIAHLLTNPEDIRHVLQHNHRGYRKADTYEPLRDLLGEGLLTAEGETWLSQRRIMQAPFRAEHVAGFAGEIVRLAEATAERWERYARSGEPLDVSKEMMALTLEVIAETMFGAGVAEDREAIAEGLTVSMEWAIHRMTMRALLPPWLPTARNRRFREALRGLDSVVDRLIERRRDGDGRDDLLRRLLEAREAGAMSERHVRDEVMTILLAGHETTSNALSWTFFLLGREPRVDADLHDELDAVLGGRSPAVDDLPRLDLGRRILDESMRLYPPAWIVERQALADDAAGGVRIPKGTIVMLSPWVTHRSPRYWARPEVFDPDRFAAARVAARPPFQHFPFGGGPRGCIGEHFARLEAHLVLSVLAQRFRVRPLVREVTPEPLITLRLREGLPARIEARRGATRRAPAPPQPRPHSA